MNRNFFYILIFAVLAAAAYFFIARRHTSTLSVSGDSVAITDTAAIQKIVISDKEGTLTLQREKEGRWSVNKRYYVAAPTIKSTLSTLYRMHIYSPLAQSALNTAQNSLQKNARTVAVFDDATANEPLRRFALLGLNNSKQGNIAQIDGQAPCLVHIPGFEGDIRANFNTDITLWRDRSVFHISPEAIASVQIEYPAMPQYSFSFQPAAKDSFIIQPLSAQTPPLPAVAMNMLAANNFFKSIPTLQIEAFENEYIRKDSVLASAPFCIISIKDTAQQQQQLTLWYKPINERSKTLTDRQGNPLRYDLDRFFAQLNEKRDFAIVQNYHFQPVLVTYPSFFIKNSP